MMRILIILLFSASIGWSQADVSVENYQKIPPSDSVFAILVDNNNHKWVGTNRGLYKLTSVYSDAEKLITGQGVFGLARARNEVWAGTDVPAIQAVLEEDVIGFDGKKLRITSMDATRSQLLVGTDQGLFVISLSQRRVLKHHHKDNSKMKSNLVNDVFVDSEDAWWIATEEGVLKYVDRDWDLYNKKESFQAVCETSEGIWLVSNQDMYLVYKIEGKDRWAPAAVRRGLSKGVVRDIASDSKGNIYLASEILVQFNPYTDRIERIDQDYGFVSAASLSLAVDRNDYVWVGTGDRGMFKIEVRDPEDKTLKAVAFQLGEIKCAGLETASIEVKVSGGTPPFQYNWKQGGIEGASAENIGAGIYELTVSDSKDQSYDLKVEVREPAPIEIIFEEIRASSGNSAYDGQARAVVSGGTPPYRLTWDNYKSSERVSNLKKGWHSITVIDKNGCKTVDSVKIEANKIMASLSDATKLNVGQTLRIDKLFFDADSTSFDEQSTGVLDEIFEFLTDNPSVVIEIGGHTNGLPPHDYCDRLSTSRAKSVALYLYRKGIPTDRISYRGYGKRNPIATNQTLQGRRKNQRVEIKILSLGT